MLFENLQKAYLSYYLHLVGIKKKKDWQVAKFQFVFHSHIFRKQISSLDEVHTGRNRDLIGYISG